MMDYVGVVFHTAVEMLVLADGLVTYPVCDSYWIKYRL